MNDKTSGVIGWGATVHSCLQDSHKKRGLIKTKDFFVSLERMLSPFLKRGWDGVGGNQGEFCELIVATSICLAHMSRTTNKLLNAIWMA